MRYFAVVSYDGTNYVGWQVQPNGKTIEGEIERVLSILLDSPIKIYGSGRTDAGVHALGQTFDFESKKIANLAKFRYSLNRLLPSDIHVKSLKKVDEDFSSRFNAVKKTYLYRLNMGENDVFNRLYVSQIHQKLDVDLIKEAAKLFVGKHSFMNFTAKEEDEANFMRTIMEIKIIKRGNVINFYFTGDGFMRYMIRMIVGTLIQIGLHKLTIDDVEEYLSSSTRKPVPYKAKANGLTLVKVFY